MPRPANPTPFYLHHKARNIAYCSVRRATVRRKDIYLGLWNSRDSKTAFARIVELVASNNGIYPDVDDDLTVNEALVLYVRFVDSHYRMPDGTPADSADQIKYALKPLRRRFGWKSKRHSQRPRRGKAEPLYEIQIRILQMLDGKAMIGKQLANDSSINMNEQQLCRDHLRPHKNAGWIDNKPVIGYFRPDRPPRQRFINAKYRRQRCAMGRARIGGFYPVRV